MEKKLFQGYEAAERLHVMSELAAGEPTGERLRYRLTRHTYRMAATETRRLDLGRMRAAAMVGCGIFPATLMFLAETTSIPSLVGIDRDPRVIELAESLIAHTGHRITLVCGGGDRCDLSSFDLLYIANGTQGKRGVLARAAAASPGGAEIIVRVPWGPGRLFYEDIDSAPPPELTRRALGRPDLTFLNRAVFFNKRISQEG